MQEQLILPFGYQFAEDRASLLVAVRASGLRRLDQAFVLMVFDVTNNGWLHKSHNELADWLHVSKSTARRCVKRSVDAGLVVSIEERYRTGGQRDNAYSIDWEGVRSYCFNSTLAEGPGVHREQPPAQNDHPPAHREQPPVQNDHPYKEYIPPSDPPKEPPPPPEKPNGGGGFLDSWGEVRSRLRSHGVADTPGAIRAAQADAISPREAGELIDQWESARPAWDVGGLYWRLTRGTWPERAAASRERDLAEQEKRRTRELLASVGARSRADPDQPSLVEQFRRMQDQEAIP
ncbi:MAG: hypothetical protein ACYC4U_11290 [Pirellulaceae bacterium]